MAAAARLVTRRRFAGALLVIATLAGTSPLFAAPGTEEPTTSLADELSGMAKAEYIAGRALYADGDYAAALIKFQSALDASKDNRLLWNLGVCHRGLRHYAEASRLLERYVREGGPRVTDAERAEANQFIAGLRPYVAAVSVHASEAGAFVFLDDKLVGVTPLEKYLVDIGQHTIVLKKDRFADHSAALTVTGTTDVLLDVKLPHEGRLVVRAGAGDTIAIDGRVVGSSSHETSLSTGVHKLRVSAPGKKASESEIVIEDGAVRAVDVSLDNSGLPLWAWVGLGAVAVTGASVAGYFIFRSDDPARPGPVLGTMQPYTHQTGVRF